MKKRIFYLFGFRGSFNSRNEARVNFSFKFFTLSANFEKRFSNRPEGVTWVVIGVVLHPAGSNRSFMALPPPSPFLVLPDVRESFDADTMLMYFYVLFMAIFRGVIWCMGSCWIMESFTAASWPSLEWEGGCSWWLDGCKEVERSLRRHQGTFEVEPARLDISYFFLKTIEVEPGELIFVSMELLSLFALSTCYVDLSD